MTEQLKQAALADRLRAVARDIRRKPYPISDIIPLLNQAADALTTSQPVPDVEAAAKKLAECMDYPWEHMPSAGRDNMRKHAEAVLAAAQAKDGV